MNAIAYRPRPERPAVRERVAARWFLCVALACLIHGACMAYFAQRRAHAAPRALRELEVELLAPEPPPPPPAPAPRPAPAPEAPPPRPVRVPERSRPAAEPPPLAKAGALLTQPETAAPAPAADAPVRFVTDPNGHGYGSGLVARGGSAERAERSAPTAEPEAPAAAAKLGGLVFAAKLSRQPVLAAADPCRGYFPRDARSQRGDVTAIATVRDHGTVARTEIEREAPLGQGFGAAARACLAQQRFDPALDPQGKPTAARIRVHIAFTR